jgi:Tfp pilus assembly ATPase PilU
MQLLDEHLWNLYEQGTVNAEDCVDRSRNPGVMQDKIDAHKRGLKADDGDDGEERAVLRT